MVYPAVNGYCPGTYGILSSAKAYLLQISRQAKAFFYGQGLNASDLGTRSFLRKNKADDAKRRFCDRNGREVQLAFAA